jgi:hypothetical protein
MQDDGERPIEILTRVKTALRNDASLDSVASRPFESRCLGAIGNDYFDDRTQVAAFDRVDNRLQV